MTYVPSEGMGETPQDCEKLSSQYFYGHGFDKDYEASYYWASKAAEDTENRHPRAKMILGVLYMDGKYVEQDYAKAIEWFREATEDGDFKAPRYLGLMCENGQGMPDDPQIAFECYKLAAERGDITGEYLLGQMYENGKGTEADIDKAIEWYRKSAERGDRITEPAQDALRRLGVQ